MELGDEFKKEKGRYANVVVSDSDGNTYYSDEYTEWLEEKVKLLNLYFLLNS